LKAAKDEEQKKKDLADKQRSLPRKAGWYGPRDDTEADAAKAPVEEVWRAECKSHPPSFLRTRAFPPFSFDSHPQNFGAIAGGGA